MGGVLTSVGHHDLLDGSILALGRGVSVAETGPPHGQQAQAAAYRHVPEHPGEKEKKQGYILISESNI